MINYSAQDLLTRHNKLVADFISDHYDKFFEHYSRLLTSSNYVTKRQSLKLLASILLERDNYTTMTTYVDSVSNLKMIMNLLRDRSKSIQYETFNVFKVGDLNC